MEYTVIFCLVLLNLCCAAHLSNFSSEAAAVMRKALGSCCLAGATLVCSSWKMMAAHHKGGWKRCINCESQIVLLDLAFSFKRIRRARYFTRCPGISSSFTV
uniref:Secreted protein n=1 Tax=Serinus canaria TaxID=9135 RepID=A0A8C9NHD0_SERCA